MKTNEKSFNTEEIVVEIKKILLAQGETLATAESCTGGLVASEIVNVSGSSSIFAGGIVAYQNSIKENLLNVPQQILDTFGAVSQETVTAMAQGALKKFNCDWAIATSGIAGPDGGTPEKPVGMVWMSVQNAKNTLQSESFCKIFLGNRREIREKSVYYVLSKLLFLLNKHKSTCTNEH